MKTKIWIDVEDASGNRLGDGPVYAVKSATITRALDGAGSFNISASGGDYRALTLLTNERRIKIYVDDVAGLRLLGQGIIRKRDLTDSPSGIELKISGPDVIDELKRRSVLLARIYNQQTVATIANSLIALVPGWTVTVDAGIASEVVDARYDGVSVLKAFQDLAKRYSYHLRLGATYRNLEISPFGVSNGLRMSRVEVVTSETIANLNLLMVQNISTGRNSEDLCNWILPIGAGEGESALTLQYSNRTTPYTIQTTTGPDGRTLYFLSDATSITTYGEIRKTGQFKEIAPLSNSEADIMNAANALYDAAAEYLTRTKVVQETYSVTVKNVQQTIYPGDKIHIDYKAQISSESGEIDYMNIRDDFYLLSVRESVSGGGTSVAMEVSNVDRAEEDVATTVMNSIESIELRGLKPSVASSTRSYVYDREIAPSYNATVPVEFTDATLYVQRIRMRLKTSPFRATATATAGGGGTTSTSAGGGDHNHRIAVLTTITGFPATTINPFYMRSSSGGSLIGVKMDVSNAQDLWTEQSSGSHTHDITIPDHTHTLAFGITDDTATPIGITLWVNGQNKTLELTGSSLLAPSGGNLDIVADAGILTNLITAAAGGLRQVHQIEVRCNGGRGRAEVTIEIFETTQSIKLS